MFKRYMALVLVLALAIGGCALAETEGTTIEWISFETPMTRVLDRTAAEWSLSSANRAMFSVLVLIDMIVDKQDENKPDLGEVSYVGRDGNILILYAELQTERALEQRQDVVVLFNTVLEEASYMVKDHWEAYMAEMFMRDMCGEKWYENDQDDIMDAAVLLSELMED